MDGFKRDSNGRFVEGSKSYMKGNHHSEEAKRRMSLALKGRQFSEEWKRKISLAHTGEKNFMFGKHHSEETRRKIGLGNLGKKINEESRRKISLATKLRVEKLNPFFGKKHSDDAKIKMSESIKKRIRLGMCPNLLQKGHKLVVGEKHPNWRGGKSFEPYGLDFNKHLKEQIRERDKFICQICGLEENGHRFDVHHIDFNKQNNNLDNLITLCHSCHTRTQYDKIQKFKVFGG